MNRELARRDLLKAAPAAAAALALGRGEAASATPVISGVPYTPSAGYPIEPKRHSQVQLNDKFWKPRVTTNAEVTIPFEFEKLAASASRREFGGGVLEAAILSLEAQPDSRLQARVDTAIARLKENPGTGNSGFEVAAAYYRATGDRSLIDNSVKSAAAIYEDFRLHNPPFSGGERDAINCIQLYRVTRDKKHLDLAKHYLDIRGLANSVNRSRHNQSYKPVLEQSEAVGHAVNCVSLMVSLADAGVFTGLHEYFDTAVRMWQDTVTRKIYITGGVGSTGNEGFGAPYALPNISAYAETCAVLMYITLNHKLFLATGESKYIDVMERGMYNNALSGVSVAGNRFFYVNRLASAGDGRDLRWERASLECCPPNLVRFLAGMPGLIYAQDKQEAIYVNLYVSSEASFQVGGSPLALHVESEMPWGGKSTITVSGKVDVPAELRLRVPGWARNQVLPGGLYSYTDKLDQAVRVSINGKPFGAAANKSGYIAIRRSWKEGDAVTIEFPVQVRLVTADTRVKENHGRIAVERGPVVYCAEWPDAPDGRVSDLLFDPAAEWRASFDPQLFGGADVIAGGARKMSNPSTAAKPVKLIPYCLWANRGAGEMSVWVSKEPFATGDTGPAGGWIFYENPNYVKDGWRYLEAAPFDQSAGAKWGCFRTSIGGARGTAVGTGKQNTADMMAACAEPESAAALCTNLNVNGVRGWFLPSRDELALMYRNLRAKGIGEFRDDGAADNFTYWASSQQTADMAVHIDFADLGRQHGDDKDFPRRVRAIRAF